MKVMEAYLSPRFPVGCPRDGDTLHDPSSPVAHACPKKIPCAPRKSAVPYCSSADTMKGTLGRNSRRSSPSIYTPVAPSSSASASCSSSRSQRPRSSPSDALLQVSSSSRGDTSLHTSVEVRKCSTACPHLLSSSRSQAFHRLFYLPVSFFTCGHRNFCCNFHSGHTLKKWSVVCMGHRHDQPWVVGRALAQCRYCPVRACLGHRAIGPLALCHAVRRLGGPASRPLECLHQPLLRDFPFEVGGGPWQGHCRRFGRIGVVLPLQPPGVGNASRAETVFRFASTALQFC